MTHGIELVFSPAALPMALAAATVFVVGFFVLGREGAGDVSRSFLDITVTVAVWLGCFASAEASPDAGTALVFIRVGYVLGVTLIPAAVFQFTAALLGRAHELRRWIVAVWGCGVAFGVVFAATKLMLDGTWRYAWGFYPRLTALSSVFLAFFAVVLASALVMLARSDPQSERERRRNAAFFIALAIGYVGSIDYLPAFGIPLFPVGCVAIAGFIALAARSIIRFRLADLSPSAVADHILRAMHGGVIVVDGHGRVQVINDVAARLLGRSASELRTADLREILGVGELPLTDSASFFRQSRTRNRAVKWKRADGSEIELSVSAAAIHDDSGEVVGVLYALADLADKRRAEEHEYGATHDLLTTLPNRTQFARAFEEASERIAAAGRIPAVLFLDLDGFKAVNDQYGHDAGDDLLKLVSSRIRRAIRGEDLLARYGGDEFVLLVDLARAEDAKLVGAKLVRVVSEAYHIGGHRILVGASIGAAFYPDDGSSCEALIRVADSAMYMAKRAGKGRIAVRTDVAGPPVFDIEARA